MRAQATCGTIGRGDEPRAGIVAPCMSPVDPTRTGAAKPPGPSPSESRLVSTSHRPSSPTTAKATRTCPWPPTAIASAPSTPPVPCTDSGAANAATWPRPWTVAPATCTPPATRSSYATQTDPDDPGYAPLLTASTGGPTSPPWKTAIGSGSKDRPPSVLKSTTTEVSDWSA